MKPTHNKVFCLPSNKPKMLFENRKKAENFIRFNGPEILENTGKAPVRSYYCPFCGGWHVTSNPSYAAGIAMDQRVKESFDSITTTWADQLRQKDERRKIAMERHRLAEAKKARIAKEKTKTKKKAQKNQEREKKVQSVFCDVPAIGPMSVTKEKGNTIRVVDICDALWRIQAIQRALDEGDIDLGHSFLSETKEILNSLDPAEGRVAGLKRKVHSISRRFPGYAQ